MESLIEAIQAALAADATDDAKHQGAHACRAILSQLDEAAPTDPAEPSPPPAPAINPADIGALIGQLRGLPLEQLLDAAIARLRGALPKGVAAPVVQPLRFQLLPVAALSPSKTGGG